MSAAVVVATLFPNPGARPSARRSGGGRLSHLVAVGCALVPLAVMGRVFALGV